MTQVSIAPHIPRRMCLGCNRRAPQKDLIRLGNASDGSVVVVSHRRHAGRTGYLHYQHACWEAFAQRKGLVRSLGRPLDKAARGDLVQSLARLAPPANEHSLMR